MREKREIQVWRLAKREESEVETWGGRVGTGDGETWVCLGLIG